MSSGQRTFSQSPSVIYIATDRSESGTNSMITEDSRLYLARILRSGRARTVLGCGRVTGQGDGLRAPAQVGEVVRPLVPRVALRLSLDR
jgi:hypothetical protein